MLAVALAELGDGRRTFGVDWDAEKIAAGQLASRDLPDGVVTLQRGDLRETPIPACDVVTIVDVLHYYEPQIQREILRRAKAALRPGGLLFIRETDPEQAGGARLTRFYERLMVRLGWNRGPKVHYLPVPELHRELEALGLVTHEVPVAGKTHPGNVLLCADGRRPEQAAPDAPMNDAR
jgi:SAM-dependent methyltransferase